MSDQLPADPSADQTYKTLVLKILDQLRTWEGANLLRYHRIGRLFAEFTDGLDCGRYGRGASVIQLAADLHTNGVLVDFDDPRRMLYHAKALFVMHPEERELAVLAAAGYSVTHSKLIAACTPEHRPAILQAAVRDNRFVSTRELRELIVAAHAAPSLEAPAETAAEPAVEVPPAAQFAGDGGPAPTTPDVTYVAPPDTPGNPELPTPTPEAAPAGATTNTVRDRTVPPTKTLNSIEKLLHKLNDVVPDVFIVIRESAQIGYDSPTAHQQYIDTLREISGTSKTVRDTLNALIAEIDGEIDAGTARPADG